MVMHFIMHPWLQDQTSALKVPCSVPAVVPSLAKSFEYIVFNLCRRDYVIVRDLILDLNMVRESHLLRAAFLSTFISFLSIKSTKN